MKTEIKVRLGLGENKAYNCSTDIELKGYQTNQITELFIDNFIELIPVENIMQALTSWKNKLRHGSSLIVTGTDIVQIAQAVLTKTVKLPQINEILFRKGNRSCLSLDDMLILLENLELKIVTKRLTDLKYTIIAERP